MSLQSKLFRGDPKLEAAAVSDPAHIVLGAMGPHVDKIQRALNLLDGAKIAVDGRYGHATAAAVLAYKGKRSIINKSYQTQADNIVGKMTIASLDREMFEKENNAPVGPVQIKPLNFMRVRPLGYSGLPAILRNPRLRLRYVVGGPPLGGDGPPLILPVNPFVTFELPENGSGVIQVINCAGGRVRSLDSIIGVVFDPDAGPNAHGGDLPVSKDDQTFIVRSGLPGRTFIEAVNKNASHSFLGTHALLTLVVQNPRPPTDFQRVQGVMHDHQPCRRWDEIRQHPNDEPDLLAAALELMLEDADTPEEYMANFRDGILGVTDAVLNIWRNQLAITHLDWFLKDGKGNDFGEDKNIEAWLLQDAGIRKALRNEILRFNPANKNNPSSWKTKGIIEFDETDYENDKFRHTFGAIDKVAYELDFGDGSIHVWFKDRFEWHPFYPNLYPVKSGDVRRDTNCLHAAGVECKAGTARDFWMIGEAFVPMRFIIDDDIL